MKFASLAALSLLAFAFAPKSGAEVTPLSGNSFEEQALEAGLDEVKEAAVLALDSDAGDVIPPSLRGAANSFDPSLGDGEGEGESCIKPGERCESTFALSSQCCSGYYCDGVSYGRIASYTCIKCRTTFFCPGGKPQN